MTNDDEQDFLNNFLGVIYCSLPVSRTSQSDFFARGYKWTGSEKFQKILLKASCSCYLPTA